MYCVLLQCPARPLNASSRHQSRVASTSQGPSWAKPKTVQSNMAKDEEIQATFGQDDHKVRLTA